MLLIVCSVIPWQSDAHFLSWLRHQKRSLEVRISGCKVGGTSTTLSAVCYPLGLIFVTIMPRVLYHLATTQLTNGTLSS